MEPYTPSPTEPSPPTPTAAQLTSNQPDVSAEPLTHLQSPDSPLGSPPNVRPNPNATWSRINARSHRGGLVAGGITLVVVGSLLLYVLFKPQSAIKKSNTSVASIDLPADQLQKLSGSSINVATDRTVSFNTPAEFKQDLKVAGQTTLTNVKITGQLLLPTAGAAAAAGNQTVAQSLSVLGISLFQGDITAKGSVAVGGNINASGTGAFAGNLSANQLSVKSAVLGNATISHLVTSGSTPTARTNNAAGNGTVSISGNDTAGTVTVTTGSGALGQGDLITVTFKTPFTSTPHVTVTPFGLDTALALSDVGGMFYVSRSTTQFTIGASKVRLGLAGVSYTFDYFVTQ